MATFDSLSETLARWMRTPLFRNGASFLLGTVFGLVVLGWILWPVEYVDTTPEMLRSDIQLDYLRMAVDSYSINGDAVLARSRFEALGEPKLDLLSALRGDGLTDPARLHQFEVLVAGLYVPGSETADPAAAPAAAGGLEDALSVLAILGILIGGGIAIVMAVNIRRHRAVAAMAPPADQEDLSLEAEEELGEDAAPVEAEAQDTEVTGGGGTEPLERFVTTYALGDDLYEDSFTINSPSGDFLGECGVGISEPIGVGEPKKITALEVWLFDRRPSRTSTTVLMSRYAHDKEDVRATLAPRGLPVLAAPGADFWMETPGLSLRVVIRELIYGSGPLPQNSYFERLTLQLEVWSKGK
ncbi:MAG: hypothetical protein JW748_09125 [Anaerolineales bacterium]|nr:hypothetical protein [Anaerolineales bacterium]